MKQKIRSNKNNEKMAQVEFDGPHSKINYETHSYKTIGSMGNARSGADVIKIFTAVRNAFS
jgi:hypothetical protein